MFLITDVIAKHNFDGAITMRYDRAIIHRPLEAINIDTGTPTRIDTDLAFLNRVTSMNREYYVVAETRIGSITSWWEQMDRDGKIKLVRIAEATDPTLDGIPLPITAASQLSEHQRNKLVCGYLVQGKFLCSKCTLTKGLTYPNAIAVYPVNILPYSQICSECKLVVFNIWRSASGGPLSLFA